MSFIVVYPSQLELLNDPAGNDYLLGYSPTVGKMVRISVNALLSGKIVPLWDPETDWLTGEKVEWNLKFWKSLDDPNVGNVPTEGDFWTEVSEGTSGEDFTLYTVLTNGGTITLDFEGKSKRKFVGSAPFATAKAIALDNNDEAIQFTFKFIINNVAAVLTLPANFIIDDIRYNPTTKIWTADYPGSYEMKGEFDGTNWWIQQIKGPFIYPE